MSLERAAAPIDGPDSRPSPLLFAHFGAVAARGRLGLARTPIIALTANAFDDDVRHTREAGMDAHLAKPYTRKQIKEKVESWL